jgi:hypothetical protein
MKGRSIQTMSGLIRRAQQTCRPSRQTRWRERAQMQPPSKSRRDRYRPCARAKQRTAPTGRTRISLSLDAPCVCAPAAAIPVRAAGSISWASLALRERDGGEAWRCGFLCRIQRTRRPQKRAPTTMRPSCFASGAWRPAGKFGTQTGRPHAPKGSPQGHALFNGADYVEFRRAASMEKDGAEDRKHRDCSCSNKKRWLDKFSGHGCTCITKSRLRRGGAQIPRRAGLP